MAGEVESNQIRNLWFTIERSYRFLIEREERIAAKSDARLQVGDLVEWAEREHTRLARKGLP
jgi:hypothetical protein